MFTLICWLFSLTSGAAVNVAAVGLAEIMLFDEKFKLRHTLVMGILVGLIVVVYRLEMVGLHIPESYIWVVITTTVALMIPYAVKSRSASGVEVNNEG